MVLSGKEFNSSLRTALRGSPIRKPLLSRAIYPHKLIGSARLDRVVNSLRLALVVEIDTTNNNSGVRRAPMVMQANEVKTIVSDKDSILGNRKRQHILVCDGAIGVPRLQRSHYIVP